VTEATIMPPPHDSEIAALCKNCGAALTGHFCANCGQPADVHLLSTKELLHEVVEGLLHGDSRLWRTLKCLWFKPGRLTQEFVAGRRMEYLPPFRLYLVLSVIFFLLASTLPVRSGDAIHFDYKAGAPEGESESCDTIDIFAHYPAFQERARAICKSVVRDNGAGLRETALETLPKAMFIFLPLVAFLHSQLYWRPRYVYAEHLVFFLHLNAFYFSAGALICAGLKAADLWPPLQGAADSLQSLLGWCMAIYTVIALRRIFAKSWPIALLKSLILSFIYIAVFSLTLAGVFFYALIMQASSGG
jgi:hypothetical protein